jgi:hypothetical protein
MWFQDGISVNLWIACVKLIDDTRIFFDFRLIHLFAKCMQKKVIIRDFSSVMGWWVPQA